MSHALQYDHETISHALTLTSDEEIGKYCYNRYLNKDPSLEHTQQREQRLMEADVRGGGGYTFVVLSVIKY